MEELDITSVGQFQTLVRYNNPVLVVKHPDKKGGAPLTEIEMKRPQTAGALLDSKRETEEILNSILPPRCWEEDGQLWQQSVSSTPATRQDVINLQEMLDTRLQQTQARETGICPVRRELYSQCFGKWISFPFPAPTNTSPRRRDHSPGDHKLLGARSSAPANPG